VRFQLGYVGRNVCVTNEALTLEWTGAWLRLGRTWIAKAQQHGPPGHTQQQDAGTNSGTVVSSGASLVLDGNVCVTNEALTLNGLGAGSGWGALDVESGIHTWAGAGHQQRQQHAGRMEQRSSCILMARSSGGGGAGSCSVTAMGGGTHFFEGSAANTFAGTNHGGCGHHLVAEQAGLYYTIPGNLVIYGTVYLGANRQMGNNVDVLVNSSGLFDLGIYYDSVNTLRGSGTVNFGFWRLYLSRI